MKASHAFGGGEVAVGGTGTGDSIEALVEKYLTVVESPRNQRNRAKWDHAFVWQRDNWRALPTGARFVIDPEHSFLSKLLGFDMACYYQDPEVQLREWLRGKIFSFERLEDDTYYLARYIPWWGVVTEVSLFGVALVFRSDREPWLASPPLLENKADLDHLAPPDSLTNPRMREMWRFYDCAVRLLGDRMEVLFPTWVRGPLCTAMQLRGMQNLLLDTIEDPQFVHRLMRFVTDCRKAWVTERARVLGCAIQPALLFNDEVGAPMISPETYREFVLPYELELAEFHGGVFYWHSCGDTTLFIKDILTLPGLQLLHVGPRTDLASVVRQVESDIALDICLEPTRDVYGVTEAEMAAQLVQITELCGDRRYYVRADAFDVVSTPAKDFRYIRRWCAIARDVVGERQ